MNSKRNMLKKITAVLFMVVTASILASVPTLAGPPVDGVPDHNSVYDYNINWAVQTATTEITVEAQANYCEYCNPNDANNPGCAAFTHPEGWCYPNNIDGRYMAVRLKDSGGTILGMQKMVLNPTNWPIGSVQSAQFVFSGLSVEAGDVITVEADTYCSWCGHWYPSPVSITVVGSNSNTVYTGDTSGLVGTSATVSATLKDSNTDVPLVGKTITFTLDALPSVSAVTDASGVASTTLPIPPGMLAGIYPMTARFDGDVDYFPSSDTVDFEVICNRPPVANAGPDQLKEQDSLGGAKVTLDGSDSYDPDGDPLKYKWTWDGRLETGVNPTVILPMGTTTVTLTVDDGQSSDTDTVDITVQDTTPPDVACLETVNPHGENVPPAGSTTPPGSKGGQNDDGFYELKATDICDVEPEFYLMSIDVDATTDLFGAFDPSTALGPYPSGYKIKYTEANGATEISEKKIGSDNGQADAIDSHVKGPHDLVVFAMDDAGNLGVMTCLVPPPPK